MRMGIGLGIGINRSNYAQGIFGAYQSRVTADGGITEGGACVDAVSSLLQSASLLLIPSGYKGGRAYAQIPTNGNGDLTWTRASDAWRTNADGLIQRVPWNLLTYSNTPTDSSWSKLGLGAGTVPVVTANAGTSPDGTTNASRVQFNCGGTTSSDRSILQKPSIALINGANYAGSIYVKAYSSGEIGKQLRFIVEGVTSQSIITLTDSWQRVAITGTSSTTSSNYIIETRGGTTTNTTADVLIYGAQLVEGSSAQTYFPTTDRLNVPRLSYMYGSCPALLLEPQRTNVAQNSGFVGTGSAPTNWAQPGGTGTSSLTSSTLGVGVQACSQSATAQRPFLQQDFAVSANTTYTFSIYVESISGTINYNNILFITNPPVGATTSYFLDGVAINEVTQATTGRLSIRLVVGATTGTISMRCGLGVGSSATASILFSRPQLEVGAYTTTFILTGVGATATRVADSFSRNNIYTNGLITSSGGTWFVELRNNIGYTRDNVGNHLILSDTSLTNFFRLRNDGTPNTRLRIQKNVSGVGGDLFLTTTNTVKIAIKWNGTTADVFVNGVKEVSATSFTATQLQDLASNPQLPAFIQAMALYPSPLSDTDCTTITSL